SPPAEPVSGRKPNERPKPSGAACLASSTGTSSSGTGRRCSSNTQSIYRPAVLLAGRLVPLSSWQRPEPHSGACDHLVRDVGMTRLRTARSDLALDGPAVLKLLAEPVAAWAGFCPTTCRP